MPNPATKPPIASQPAQVGKRRPKMAAEHHQHRVAHADPAEQHGHAGPGQRRQRLGNVPRVRLGLGDRLAGGRREAEQRVISRPRVVGSALCGASAEAAGSGVGPVGGQVVAGHQIGEGAVDGLAVVVIGLATALSPSPVAGRSDALPAKICSAS